jgi:hypothetical protein
VYDSEYVVSKIATAASQRCPLELSAAGLYSLSQPPPWGATAYNRATCRDFRYPPSVLCVRLNLLYFNDGSATRNVYFVVGSLIARGFRDTQPAVANASGITGLLKELFAEGNSIGFASHAEFVPARRVHKSRFSKKRQAGVIWTGDSGYLEVRGTDANSSLSV